MLVELDAAKLISPIVHDLHTGGATPVVAIERALEAHIFQCFQNSLVSRLIKPPRVRLHESYFKERFANLKSLAKSGYETWASPKALQCNGTCLKDAENKLIQIVLKSRLTEDLQDMNSQALKNKQKDWPLD